jgi:Flp pilus assembly CpaE family ATPase
MQHHMYPLTVAVVVSNSGLADEVHASLRDLPVHVILRQPERADGALFADQLSRLQVDVLFLEMRNSFEEIVRCVRSADRPPSIVAINDSPDHETVLAAIRAGAEDYIYPPVMDKMRGVVERFARQRGPGNPLSRPSGKVLAFTSSKGGCGATTIASHAASAFQRITDKKILLADLDLDSGLIAFLMKVRVQYSMLEAARNLDRLDPSY